MHIKSFATLIFHILISQVQKPIFVPVFFINLFHQLFYLNQKLPPSGILLPTNTKNDSVAAGLLLPAFCLTFFSNMAFIMLNLYFLSQRNLGLISGSFDLGCFYAIMSILSLSCSICLVNFYFRSSSECFCLKPIYYYLLIAIIMREEIKTF